MNKTMWAVIGISLMLGAITAAGITYWYTSEAVEDAFAEGMAYQASITPAVVVGVPASLTCTLTAATFNHTDTVGTDGDVTTETDVNDTLTIENTDETRTAEDTYLLFYNPVTDKEGLHDNLETDSTEASVTIGGLTTKLFHDGDYTEGYFIGDIPAGAEIAVTVTVTLEKAVAGTFQNGQTYTCYLYVYQPDANYCDVVSFTIST